MQNQNELQQGDGDKAEVCKTSYTGSIPVRASNSLTQDEAARRITNALSNQSLAANAAVLLGRRLARELYSTGLRLTCETDVDLAQSDAKVTQGDGVNIAAIRERLEKATPGPWRHRIDDEWAMMPPDRIIDSETMVIVRDEDCSLSWKQNRDEANFDFIAHAPTDIAALLARVEELEQTLEVERADYAAAIQEALCT